MAEKELKLDFKYSARLYQEGQDPEMRRVEASPAGDVAKIVPEGFSVGVTSVASRWTLEHALSVVARQFIDAVQRRMPEGATLSETASFTDEAGDTIVVTPVVMERL